MMIPRYSVCGFVGGPIPSNKGNKRKCNCCPPVCVSRCWLLAPAIQTSFEQFEERRSLKKGLIVRQKGNKSQTIC